MGNKIEDIKSNKTKEKRKNNLAYHRYIPVMFLSLGISTTSAGPMK